MNTDNGSGVCSDCIGELEPRFRRKRIRKYTSEEGPAEETTRVTVARCSTEGRYKTIYPREFIRNKHYSLHEIQSVLDGRNEYSLASERTKVYWRSWYSNMCEFVVNSIWQVNDRIIAKEAILTALHSFLQGLGDKGLRYVLNLFSTGINNLCMFFDLLDVIIGTECENLYTTHRNGCADIAARGDKPSPGG